MLYTKESLPYTQRNVYTLYKGKYTNIYKGQSILYTKESLPYTQRNIYTLYKGKFTIYTKESLCYRHRKVYTIHKGMTDLVKMSKANSSYSCC